MNTDPAPVESSGEPLDGDVWQEMSKRAKAIAKEIEEKVRKATGKTPAGTPPPDDSTDELPPLTDEAPPLP